jgi:hypothetical protein
MKLEEWKTLSQEEKQKFWENEKNKLEAEKLKLAEAMELANENESGIIKIEIRKGDKVVTASMHLAEYSMIKFLHNIHLGDDMIDNLINELKD